LTSFFVFVAFRFDAFSSQLLRFALNLNGKIHP
jgi:hypothetical protein